MASTVTLQALGLNTSPNPIELQPGSLTEATNIIIKRNDVIEPRRGFKLYDESFGSTTDRAKQLLEYQNRIIIHYASTLSFDTGIQDSEGLEIFNNFYGSYLEPQPGLRIKSVEANGNLYFTTSNGIYKISSNNISADFGQFPSSPAAQPGYITKAGGIQATDFSLQLSITPGQINGFLQQDSAVAYRIVWGTTDANGNLILGAPSNSVTIYNPLLGLLIPDFDRVLQALDNIFITGSLINYGTFFPTYGLQNTASAGDVYANLQGFANTLDTHITYADTVSAPLQISTATISGGILTINFSSGNPTNYVSVGSPVFLEGFNPTTGQLDGGQIVAGVTTSSITINTSATGTVTLSTPFIQSNIFRSITVPTAPAIPATDQDLVNLQTYLQTILTDLQELPPAVISSALETKYLLPITLTTSADVILTIDIPAGITSNYFFQIYRSAQVTATGTDVLANLVPNDELKLDYEAYPTAAQLAAGQIIVKDVVPESFLGANLYTNPFSGEGILQANDPPPFALDINRYKNYIFFANTSTQQQTSLTLLGVSNFNAGLITNISVANPTVITTQNAHGLSTGDIVWIDNTNSTPVISGLYSATVTGANTFTVPVNVTGAGNTGYYTDALISISDGATSSLYKFIPGVNQQTSITTTAGTSLGGKYFTINSAENNRLYYVWYDTGSSIDPMVSGLTGIPVSISSSFTAAQVATYTANTLSTYVSDFTASASSNVVTVTNIDPGYTNSPTVGTSGFTIAVTHSGEGNNASKQEVLISDTGSPGIDVEQTARNLVTVVNRNPSESVYLYYLSGPSDSPGQLLIQGKDLSTPAFYVIANNSSVGASFSPNISPFPEITITNSAANPTVVTAANHGLVSGDQVLIEMSNSTPPIDGVFTATFLTTNTFSVPVNVTIAGTTGVMRKASNALTSQNQGLPNRIYYSKFQQPEAVPATNTIDVGAEHKAILRIFPLRDSLFVFKEDGLYRISGDTAPFSVSLFDGSCVLLAPDTVDTTNNLVYGWTTQGICTVSESGVSSPLSRPIDVNILKNALVDFTHFTTATFGVGYPSDNAYYVWTVSQTTDTEATICYRYSNLTGTWTTFDKTNTCGLVGSADDKLYLGAGDTNNIEQERKSFNRYDYADRQINTSLVGGTYLNGGLTLKIPSTVDVNPGDVVVQDQDLTIYEFNSLLLKLDNDPGVGTVNITSISTGTTVTINTAVVHNLVTGDYVTLLNTNSAPIIDGTYQVTVLSTTSFTVVVTTMVVSAGTSGMASLNYFSTLKAVAGDNLRTDLVKLATKLSTDPLVGNSDFLTEIASIGPVTLTGISATDPAIITSVAHGLQTGRVIILTGTDSTPTIDGTYAVTVIDANHFSVPASVSVSGTTGTYSTLTQDFADITASYNVIIDLLNTSGSTAFKNYAQSTTTTSQEMIITAVNTTLNEITVNLALDLIVGPMTIYEAINSTFTYSPITMQDPLGLKHLREATLMFENRAFTTAELNFATDLLPQFIPVTFTSDGNGIFGFKSFGNQFFGGASNSAPMRTYIPRQCQRCRYLVINFNHGTAREFYSLLGITVTGEVGQSSRAFR